MSCRFEVLWAEIAFLLFFFLSLSISLSLFFLSSEHRSFEYRLCKFSINVSHYCAESSVKDLISCSWLWNWTILLVLCELWLLMLLLLLFVFGDIYWQIKNVNTWYTETLWQIYIKCIKTLFQHLNKRSYTSHI